MLFVEVCALCVRPLVGSRRCGGSLFEGPPGVPCKVSTVHWSARPAAATAIINQMLAHIRMAKQQHIQKQSLKGP